MSIALARTHVAGNAYLIDAKALLNGFAREK
jgi:hypothetical protein